jgi:hypothetical protein
MGMANEEGPNQLVPKATTPGQLDEQGWPESFLHDFESRIWITYRSNFPPIPKPINQDAFSAMTLSVRLRSQLVDQHGFTSDTGWGCMIRSGQSLLANAMSILLFGRGNNQRQHFHRCSSRSELTCIQVGVEESTLIGRPSYCYSLQITRMHLSQYIDLSSMVPSPVTNILGNGLALPQPPDAYSMSQSHWALT